MKIYNTTRKYKHCIHVKTDFKAQQMLPTDRLQVFVLMSLAHRIAFSDFLKPLLKCKTREHTVSQANQVLLLHCRKSLS